MCPPPDTGLQSIAYRLDDFPGLGTTLLSVGLTGAVTIKLLMTCVQATATPQHMRNVYWCAVASTIASTAPFVGSVVVATRWVLLELMHHESHLRSLLPAYVVRNLVCGLVILLLGLAIAAAPALIATLSSHRLQLATEQRQPSLRERQLWAAGIGSLVTAELAGLTWMLGREFGPHQARTLPEGLICATIMLPLLVVTGAAVALPLRAANRAPRAVEPQRAAFTEPSRFTA